MSIRVHARTKARGTIDIRAQRKGTIMEKLAALCVLCGCGLGDEYPAELNRLFLENPNDDLLLELENFGKNYEAAWELLREKIADKFYFEKELFKSLGKFYESGKTTLREFAVRCNDLEGGVVGYVERKYADFFSGAFQTFCWLSDAVEGILAADEAERITVAKTTEIKRNLEAVFERYKE